MSADPISAAIDAAAERAVKKALAEFGITLDAISKPRNDGLIDTGEALRRLHLRSRATLLAYEQAGRLKRVTKVGGKNLYRAADIEALLRSTPPEAA